MPERRYVAADSPEEIEMERLNALEEMRDGLIQRRLESLGIRLGWRCLEVGAGRGSIARCMTEVVGPTGQAVAIDLNPDF